MGVSFMHQEEQLIYVHSFETLAALDGPGLRLAVFLQGCNLRCAYCHNPDTWEKTNGRPFTPQQLVDKILRYKSYFGKNGGVTFSGGEPLLQAKALLPVMALLKKNQINVVVDTAGNVKGEAVKKLLGYRPLLLLDIKMPTQKEYDQYIGGSLTQALETLKIAQEQGCKVWIRYVVIAGVNDQITHIKTIVQIAHGFSNIEKISLLPYHHMGAVKYEKMGKSYGFTAENVPSATQITLLEQEIAQTF